MFCSSNTILKNFGIDTLWVNVKNEENPFGDKITYIVNNLEEIPNLLLK
jgi:hypothetical protein